MADEARSEPSLSRDGRWWPIAALGAVLAAVAGAVMVVVAGSGGGVGSAVSAEGLFGLALLALGLAVVWRRRVRHDQPDVEPPAGFGRGRQAVLAGLGRSYPEVATEALAEVRDEGRVVARLHRWSPGPVTARLPGETGPGAGGAELVAAFPLEDTEPTGAESPPDPEGPDGADGEGQRAGAGVVSIRARRARRERQLHLSGLAERRLRVLEHRRGDDIDVDPDGPGRDGGEVPVVVGRLVDQRGNAVAGAHAFRRGDLEDWVVPTATHTLRLRARRTHALTYRHRPTRRTFIDTDGVGFLARTRRRPRRWELTAPHDLEPDAALLCLWLVHLLDVHTLLGRAWTAPSPTWTPVEDEFPVWVGPGGFGDPRPPSSGGAGATGTGM